MIGYSPQKMIAIQSTSGFQRMPSGYISKADKYKSAAVHDSSVPNNKVGGTLSYSQKSLQSNTT